MEQQLSIPVLSLERHGNSSANLTDGLPPNPIIDESLRLYEAELARALG
jgi:hypothetical protein